MKIFSIITMIVLSAKVFASTPAQSNYTDLLKYDIAPNTAHSACKDATEGEAPCIVANVAFDLSGPLFARDQVCEGMTKQDASCFLYSIESGNFPGPITAARDCTNL
jgi:hypothetical protein